MVGVALLLPMMVFNLRVSSLDKAFGHAIFHKVVSETLASFGMMKDLGTTHGHPMGIEDVRLAVPLCEAPTCVVVIGESATRNNFGIYGYERDTTPRLAAVGDDLCVFTDLVGSWHSTMLALRYLFTGATAEDKAHARLLMTQAVKLAGYRQTFITNVSRIGSINNFIGRLFDVTDEQYYLKDFPDTASAFDDALLPPCQRALSSGRGAGQVVYLHQNGSHYPFVGVYPKEWTVFDGGTVIDHYDNTVAFTDYNLGEVIKMLEALHRPAMMFYVSDHGETPRSKSWRTYGDLDLWELPMVVWFSKEYQEVFPETVQHVRAATSLPLQSDQVLPALLEMMQIRGWSDTESERNFLNPSFVPRQQRLIKEWKEEYRP